MTHGALRGVRAGKRRPPEYKSWESMMARCYNPRSANYDDYGGRGVQVCDRWKNFALFLEDMGARPPRTSLGRIDTNGDYEPSNCRWETAEQQQNNKRNNRTISIDGQSLTYSQWERRMGLRRRTISQRLFLGWDERRAVMAPLDTNKQRFR